VFVCLSKLQSFHLLFTSPNTAAHAQADPFSEPEMNIPTFHFLASVFSESQQKERERLEQKEREEREKREKERCGSN